MNYNEEIFADPVDVPEDVPHGGSVAYNDYHCRCRHCTTYARMKRQVGYWRSKAERLARHRRAEDYLVLRGITLCGPGPFRESPLELARIVANYLGHDIDAWMSGTGRNSR